MDIIRPDIVFLDAKTVGDTNNLSRLSALGNVIYHAVTKPEDIVKNIGNASVVITNKVCIDKAAMDSCPAIKLICIAATGMNNIDLEYAAKKMISVRNVTGYSTESVVQVTFSLLLHLTNKIRYYDDYTKSGSYFHSDIFTNFNNNFREIAGKQFGIIGLGAIGKRVAEVASAFKASVVYYSTTGRNLRNTYTHLCLDDLLETSDFVSVHCPLTPSTKKLIGYEQLLKMKRKAFLINAGRGGIISETDLARALDEGIIAGAGLDVFEKEPPMSDNPLFSLKHPERIVMTPHLAWASDESRERLIDGIIENIKSYINEIQR